MTCYLLDTSRGHNYFVARPPRMIATTLMELHLMADLLGIRDDFEAPPPGALPMYHLNPDLRPKFVALGGARCSIKTFNYHKKRIAANWEIYNEPLLGKRKSL